ncbi:ATP-binding protein [Streptomyces sp. B21-105]|uniref:ATP-binding protein n=1 Tax=Streptomyces sp. B21-105 TaxID=3039417 RepID=UPI002FEFEE27
MGINDDQGHGEAGRSVGEQGFDDGEPSFGDVEHLKGFQSLRPDLSQETRDLVLAMRGLFKATRLSLRVFAARHHFSAPSVSRYLKGDRIPDKQFLDVLMKSACERNGWEVTADLQAHLYQRYREALMADQPARCREQMASDRLEDAVLRQEDAELRIHDLEGNLSRHREQLDGLRTRMKELEAACALEQRELGSELDLYRRQKADLEVRGEHLRETIAELEAALAEAVRERDAARARCGELEAELVAVEESADRERLERRVAEERLRVAKAEGAAAERRVDLERAKRDAERLRLEAEAQAREIIEEANNRVTRIRPSVVTRSAALRQLRDAALEVADVRLPAMVEGISPADSADVVSTVKPIGIQTKDEIGEVARAFDRLHLQAVRIAAEQASLRAVFGGMARRQKAFIEAQLDLVFRLRRPDSDAGQLEGLFRLNHLAARLGRISETLQLLAGGVPDRYGDRGVRLADVFRAASFEVEQYERFDLSGLPEVEIRGVAASGLVHLLAELLENAATFSSPKTEVRVTGYLLPDGRVLLEIHDQGCGLTLEDFGDVNARLADLRAAPDAGTSERMGLFVVRRICELYGFRVQLRPSDRGGVTALIMLSLQHVNRDRPDTHDTGAWSPDIA